MPVSIHHLLFSTSPLPLPEISHREATSRHFPICSGKCCRNSTAAAASVCHNHNSSCCQSLHLEFSDRDAGSERYLAR